ncbi:MAG TPA: TMEM175 family protein [Candidatus Limnocylindria bacterium]
MSEAHGTGHEHRGAVPMSRLEAFSDGVFAIAATLLILDVTATSSPLSTELLRIWPSYVAYAVTFITIGIVWINHGTVLSLIKETDRTFLTLNILLLTVIAFVPFPTRLLAAHLFDEDARAATLLYGITLVIGATIFTSLWFYGALHRRLLKPTADEHLVQGISRSYLPGPFLYLGGTLVALYSPMLSAAIFMAIALFYLVEATIFARG